MRKKFLFLTVLLTSVLQGFLFYPADVWWLAYFAWIPLILYVAENGALASAGVCLLGGYIFFLTGLFWLWHVEFLAPFGVALLMAPLMIPFGLLGSYIYRHLQLPLALILPPLWIFVEYLRSFVYTGLPWLYAGHTQFSRDSLIQISDQTGVWGVSWLVIAVNAALAELILFQRYRFSKWRPITSWSLVVLLFAGFLHYGNSCLKEIPTPQKRPLKLCLVQGNIPFQNGPERTPSEVVFEKMKNLTLSSKEQHPNLIIWPETIIYEAPRRIELQQLTQECQSALLLGSPSAGPGERPDGEECFYNSAYLFDADGRRAGRYDKEHLVPFGEYLPLPKLLFFLEDFVRFAAEFESGGKQKLLETQGLKFSVLICFEDAFPQLSRERTLQGADFLVAIGNDAWFRDSAELWQHSRLAAFRAIETRIPMVRSTNTGITSVIDAFGKQVAVLKDKDREIELEGILFADLPGKLRPGAYLKYGDWLAYFATFAMVVLLFLADLKKRKRSTGSLEIITPIK